MNDFVEKFKHDVKEIWKQLKTAYAQLTGKKVAKDGSVVSDKSEATYEINLVPEVKAQMIKALKIRNLVLFICIVVSAVAMGVVLVLFGVKSGQDIAMYNQDKKLEKLSEKLLGYEELEDLVTIQHQLGKYEELKDRKTVLSRVFGALGVMLLQGNDDVRLSDLRVNLETSLVMMEGQADARVAPLIDYRVLESFKKSVDLMRYDYGRYVDIDGKELPTQCIDEADAEGNAYRTGDSYYAWWDLTIEGCEGSVRSVTEYQETEYHYSAEAETELGVPGHETVKEIVCDENGENCQEVIRVTDVEQAPEPAEGEEQPTEGEAKDDEEKEDLTPRPVKVKIWRTPQYNKWHADGQMGLDGMITGIEHFVSECYTYKGTQVGKNVRWTSVNDCVLAPDGLTISGSSNGRDESDNLVLKFTASVKFDAAFFAFANKHMIAIGPMGQNVTDSFVQIGGMFTQEAETCELDDTECLNNSANTGR